MVRGMQSAGRQHSMRPEISMPLVCQYASGGWATALDKEIHSPAHCRGPWLFPTASHQSRLSCPERPWVGWRCGGGGLGNRLGLLGSDLGSEGRICCGCSWYWRVYQPGEFWYQLIPEKKVAIRDYCPKKKKKWTWNRTENCVSHIVNEGSTPYPPTEQLIWNATAPGFLVGVRW